MIRFGLASDRLSAALEKKHSITAITWRRHAIDRGASLGAENNFAGSLMGIELST